MRGLGATAQSHERNLMGASRLALTEKLVLAQPSFTLKFWTATCLLDQGNDLEFQGWRDFPEIFVPAEV